jgi:tetratricopeptide (TPR) repeat protein
MKPYEDANVTPYEDANVTSEEEAQLENRLFIDPDFVLRQLAVVNDNQLKRFLLGDVTSEEEAQLEDRLFDDRDFVHQLAVAEEELIDDYLRGRLTDDERNRFESHFMRPHILSAILPVGRLTKIGWVGLTDERREQLLMIKALKRYAENSKRGSAGRLGENRLDFRHWIRHFFTPISLSGVSWKLAAGALILLGLLALHWAFRPKPTAPPQNSQKEGDSSGDARALSKLGDLEKLRGNYDLARQHYTEALRLNRKEGNMREEADTLLDLGELESAQGSADLAYMYYSQASDLFRKEGNRLGEANALRGLGDLDSKHAATDLIRRRARQHYDEAAELYDAIGMQDKAAECRKLRAGLERKNR